MIFTPVRGDEASYAEYVRLFTDCFPGVNKFSRNYLHWLYHLNPDGEVVGFDARDGDRLAAHYVCIPASLQLGGQSIRALLSLNTATHPDYQGQRLFTKLAELTYAAGANQGYDCVYGVANANSTPGLTRTLGFQLVSPLRACVGIGPVGIDFSRKAQVQFQRIWNSQTLAWRRANPVNPVMAHISHDRTTFLAPALLGSAVLVAAEINTTEFVESSTNGISPLRLFIGIVPPTWQRRTPYVNIPMRLRPSPLNMIYRSLSGRIESLDSDTVFLNFLDFDAY